MSLAAPSRTRIVFLINDLGRAGAETQLVELALALDPAAYDVRIVILKRKNDFVERLAERGIPVTPLGRRGWWDFAVLWRLYRRLRHEQPDVLHCSLFLANLLGVLAGKAAGAGAIVLWQQCSYREMLAAPLRPLARWSHRQADRVLVVSEAILNEEVAAGMSPARLAHVPNGVPLRPVSPVPRAKLQLPEGPLAVCVGQFSPAKGHRYILEAWPTVTRSLPDARLVLVGDGPLRAQLREAARRLGLEEAVLFLGFRRSPEPLIAACDVFVQPSLTEGMPVALLEAMSLGRPVVATRVGGNAEAVRDGETGLLVPPGEPSVLASAVVELLTDRSRAAAMGQAGRRRVQDLFSLERTRAAAEEVYRGVLLTPRSATSVA